MKMKIKYVESEFILENEIINVIEIENKNYFYRVINDLNKISNGELIESIIFCDQECKEINLANKIKIIADYFNVDFNDKKYINSISKLIYEVVSEEDRIQLSGYYKKLNSWFKKVYSKIDIKLTIENDLDIESIIKIFKIVIDKEEFLLENLFTLIDIEKILNINKIIVLINLKQYLNKVDIVELYKYAIYNDIKLILVDSICHGVTLQYEKKLIIDENLEEFVI